MRREDRARLIADVEREWAAVGLRGSFLARDLRTGREIGLRAHEAWPLASVVKLPLAAVVLDAFARGEARPDEQVVLDVGDRTAGPTGIALLRHPCRVALEDLVRLALALSDNAAADALFARWGPAEVTTRLRSLGVEDAVVRHPMRSLYGTSRLVHSVGLDIAVRGGGPDGDHVIDELAVDRANVGTARGLVGLLDAAWADRLGSPGVGPRLREMLGHQTTRHRLASELVSDTVRVRSKTGTFLSLRHEVGVVEAVDGAAGRPPVAIAMLTRCAVPAIENIEADLAIGQTARMIVEALHEAGDQHDETDQHDQHDRHDAGGRR